MKKQLLSEGEVRRFAKLSKSNISEQRMQEMGYNPTQNEGEVDYPEEEGAPEDLGLDDEPMDDAPLDDAPVDGMDDAPLDDAPMDDMGGEDMDMDGLNLDLDPEEKEELLGTIVSAVGDALGLETEVESDGEEDLGMDDPGDEPPMDDEPMGDEPPMDDEAGDEPPMDLGGEGDEAGEEESDEDLYKEDLVNEVTKRVMQRLVSEAKRRKASKKNK